MTDIHRRTDDFTQIDSSTGREHPHRAMLDFGDAGKMPCILGTAMTISMMTVRREEEPDKIALPPVGIIGMGVESNIANMGMFFYMDSKELRQMSSRLSDLAAALEERELAYERQNAAVN